MNHADEIKEKAEDIVAGMSFVQKCRHPGVNPQKFGLLSWRQVLFIACDTIDRQARDLKELALTVGCLGPGEHGTMDRCECLCCEALKG